MDQTQPRNATQNEVHLNWTSLTVSQVAGLMLEPVSVIVKIIWMETVTILHHRREETESLTLLKPEILGSGCALCNVLYVTMRV